jgi:uncharacterized protein
MHNRLEPKPHRFHYNVFMFYIDLDEIDLLVKKFPMISRNKFNFFSFRDSEHLQLPAGSPDKNKSTKEHIVEYLNQNGVRYTGQKIMLLTNLNIMGYNFNPVSFYFVFDKDDVVECAIAEVSNTFREMKPYFFPKETFKENKFHLNVTKYFYVSPFIDHDASFDFTLYIPGEKLNIKIDDYKNNKRFFISTLTGARKPITNSALILNTLRFPFLTLRIMTLIHWNAVQLWIKKIPYHKKNKLAELQRDVYNKK